LELAIATVIGAGIKYGIGLLSNTSNTSDNDDDLPKSSYSFAIEQLYGRHRLNGRLVFWAIDLEETEESAGGKGGSRTQIRYLATFAVIVCDGTLAAYNRIWFGKDLVYSSSPNENEKTREKSEEFFNDHAEFYYGSSTQQPSPEIQDQEGIGNVPALRGTSYIVIKKYPVSSRNFPSVDVEATRGDPPTFSDAILPADIASTDTIEFAITHVCEKVGITADQLEFDDYMKNQIVDGAVFRQDNTTPQQFIGELQKIYNFFPDDQGDKIFWKHKRTPQSEGILLLNEDDLGAKEVDSEVVDPYEIVILDPIEIPSRLQIEFPTPDNNHDLSQQYAWDANAKHQKEESIRTDIVLYDKTANEIAWRLMADLIEQRTRIETLYLLPSIGEKARIGGLVNIPIEGENFLFQVTNKKHGENELYTLDLVIYNDAQFISSIDNNYSRESNIYSAPTGEVIALDIPLIQDSDIDFGIYLGIKSTEKWKLGEIYVSSDFGSTYQKLTDFTGRSVTGKIIQIPQELDTNFIDYTSEIIVELDNEKPLENIGDSAFYNLQNLGLFGDEFIAWKNAELIGTNRYRLTTLLRGQRGTEWAISEHNSGEDFVLLRGTGKKLIRVSGDRADIGKTLIFRAVHVGASVDEISNLTTLKVTGEALKTYAPTNIHITKNTTNNDLIIHWTLRTRRYGAMINGVGISQVDSELVVLKIIKDDQFIRTINTTESQYIYLASQQIEDHGTLQSEISIEVAQNSDLVGVHRSTRILNLSPSRFI